MLSSMSLRCCRAGLRMLPRSPPVQVTTRTSTPSETYRAIVAAPLLDSSSGCAWTAISRSCSAGALTTELSPDPTGVPLLAWVAASVQRIRGHSNSANPVVGATVTETGEAPVTWLTQEAFDRLKSEYEYLSGPGRTEISKKIGEAREEGDLKENGGYHAAKEEQGKCEDGNTHHPARRGRARVCGM